MRRNPQVQDGKLQQIEHMVSLVTSAIWTGIVLVVLVIIWGYHDAKAQWEYLEDAARSQALHESVAALHNVATEDASMNASPITYHDAEMTPWATAEDAPQVLPETPLDQLTVEPTPPPPQPTATFTPTLDDTPALVQDPESVLIPTPSPSPLPTDTPPPSPTPSPAPQPTPTARDGENPGAPSRLVVQTVGIDTPVIPVHWTTIEQGGLEYSMWEVADYAAGWHSTSALPGQPGNTVLAGHHNINGEVFRYLVDVQEGDEIEIFVGETPYKYTVEQKLIVKEKDEPLEVRQRNAQWIAPTNDVRLTLITCWPYTNNTHRVIVVAKPTS
jgi:LPXTG-site transpeptidase (sortase) family protein